jgi:hypothetical protein
MESRMGRSNLDVDFENFLFVFLWRMSGNRFERFCEMLLVGKSNIWIDFTYFYPGVLFHMLYGFSFRYGPLGMVFSLTPFYIGF